MSKKRYNPEIDLLKFLFSIIILSYHGEKVEAIGKNFLFPFGFTAVEFFFIISGYLMVKSSKRYGSENIGKNTMSFVYNKAKGLYPPFFFAFLAAFTVREIDFFLNKGYSIFDFGKDILSSAVGELLFLMKTGAGFGTEFNGPTWYICTMLFAMAILFPILIKHREWFVNVGSVVIAIFIYGNLYQFKHSINYLNWAGITTMAVLRAIAGLCLGCFVSGLTERIKEKGIELKKAGKIVLGLAELGLIFIILFIMQREGKNYFDYVCIVYIFFLCLIVLSGLTGIKDILPNKFCSFLGDCSLLLYLNHRYCARIIDLIGFEASQPVVFAVYFALTCAMSVVCKLTTMVCHKIWVRVMPKIKSMLIKQTVSVK